MGTDDDGNLQTTDSLIDTFYLNLFVFGCLVAVLELFRHQKSVYFTRMYSPRYRKSVVNRDRVPEKPSWYPFAWIGSIYSIDEKSFLRMVGLDGYMLLRFIAVCFKVCMFCSFFGCVVLVPVYQTAALNQEQRWNKFTMANIPDDYASPRLWAPVVFVYVFSWYYCYLFYLEYKAFIKNRTTYLEFGDNDTRKQTYYTVIVENVPNDIKSVPMLTNYFEALFPGQIYSVEIALDVSNLEFLCDSRQTVRNKLEKSIAVFNATYKRQTLWVKPSDVIEAESEIESSSAKSARKVTTNSCSTSVAGCMGYVIVDAIEHYTKMLVCLNGTVIDMQKFYSAAASKQQREDSSRLVKTKEQLSSLSQTPASRREGKSMKSAITDRESPKGASNLDVEDFPSESIEKTTSNPMVDKYLDMHPYVTTDSGMNDDDNDSICLSERNSRRSDLSENQPSISDSKGTEQPTAGDVVIALKDTTLKAAVGIGGFFVAATQEGLKAQEGATKLLLHATDNLKMVLLGKSYQLSSTAFVTFRHRVPKAASQQMFLSHTYQTLKVKSAPSPKDLIWENVSIPEPQIQVRKSLADIYVVIGALFWSVFVASITALTSLDSISQSIPSLQAYSDYFFYQFMNTYLAIGILLIVLTCLPFLFDFISRSYEGQKTESEIQGLVLTRYFYYLLANVFVALTLGSVTYSMKGIINNPANILSILGTSVPSFSIYFSQFVIIKTFTGIPLEMLRLGPLIVILGTKLVTNKKTITRREMRSGVFSDPPMLYGWIYPNLLMVLMIAVTYWCIAPFVLPFCAMFYALAYLMYKYQLLYVYVNPEQSGGFLWYSVFDKSMVALLWGVSTLMCYLIIRRTFFSGPFYFLIPLPFIISIFWRNCDQAFKVQALNLSLESAIYIDMQHDSNKADGMAIPLDEFNPLLFRQSSLKEGPLSASVRESSAVPLDAHGNIDIESAIEGEGEEEESVESPNSGTTLSPEQTAPYEMMMGK
jgi:hypothetical protein